MKTSCMTCSVLLAFKLFACLLPTAISVSAAMSEISATPVDYTCNVFELRQYTLKPGQRDVLIELFDREFIETQEAAGMHVCGQFRGRRPSRAIRLDSRVCRHESARTRSNLVL